MNINDVWQRRVTKITQHAEAKLTQNNQIILSCFPNPKKTLSDMVKNKEGL